MSNYEGRVRIELSRWQSRMMKKPSLMGRLTKGLQVKTNKLIPVKVHQLITASMKTLVRTVLTGSEFTTGRPLRGAISLEERERLVLEKLNSYKKAAVVEGAGTGAGGILLGLADLPLLLSIKMKFLFDVASLYGFDVKAYEERLYVLYLFQLAFSSEQRRVEVYRQILHWEETIKAFPPNLDAIDWQLFQQEYRDYLDLAKMLQMLPGIGAVVGAYVNYRLLDKLGETAMNGYRLRILKNTD